MDAHEGKKLVKVDLPPTQSPMGVRGSIIIVEVHLHEMTPQNLEPSFHGDHGEEIEMPGIKTKTEVRIVDFFDEHLERIRILIEYIFDGNTQSSLRSGLHDLVPRIDAVIEPYILASAVPPSVIGGVKYGCPWLKNGGDIQKLPETHLGYGAHHWVDGTRIQVHERSVESQFGVPVKTFDQVLQIALFNLIKDGR